MRKTSFGFPSRFRIAFPSIFSMSSSQVSILGLFVRIVRQQYGSTSIARFGVIPACSSPKSRPIAPEKTETTGHSIPVITAPAFLRFAISFLNPDFRWRDYNVRLRELTCGQNPSSTTQPKHEQDSRKKHAARTRCPPISVSPRIPLQASSTIPAGIARSGIPGSAKGHLRPRLFLAPAPSMQRRADSQVEGQLLVSETSPKRRKGSAERSDASSDRMESDDCLGM